MKIIPISLSLSQIYLLPCSGGYLQIDTGYERDYPRYRRELARAGIAIDQIKYVLLTHHHDDHAGSLNPLTQDADVIVIAHEQAEALLKTGQNDKTRGGGYVNGLVKFLAGLKMRLDPHWTLSYPPFALRPQDLRVAGDDDRLLREVGVAGRILTTPGHSVDHLALVLDDGSTFCGDAAASFLLWAGTHYCTIFMTDMEAAYESWARMLAAGAKTIYPAHGRPFAAQKLRRNMGKIQTAALARFF